MAGFIIESRIKVGNKYYNNQGDEFEVIQYISSSAKTGGIIIRFLSTGCIKICSGSDLLKGEVKDNLKPSVCGVGYMGVGDYKAWENNQKTQYYLHWHNMLKRCYELKNSHAIAYKDCFVSEKWHNLQVFAEWCVNQKLYGNNTICGGVALDKDLLYPNNNIYAEDNCLIIPSEINTALTGKHRNGKTGNLPCGVYKHGNKYVTMSNSGNNFDRFNTLEQAVENYKHKKQQRIKFLLNKYVDYLDEKTIFALENFNVSDRLQYQ